MTEEELQHQMTVAKIVTSTDDKLKKVVRLLDAESELIATEVAMLAWTKVYYATGGASTLTTKDFYLGAIRAMLEEKGLWQARWAKLFPANTFVGPDIVREVMRVHAKKAKKRVSRIMGT